MVREKGHLLTGCQITDNVNSELIVGRNDQNFIAFCNE